MFRATCHSCSWRRDFAVWTTRPEVCGACGADFFIFETFEKKEKPKPCGPIVIVVCLGCEFSLCCQRSELPEKCPICLEEPATWRITDPDELTRWDRKFLSESKIAV